MSAPVCTPTLGNGVRIPLDHTSLGGELAIGPPHVFQDLGAPSLAQRLQADSSAATTSDLTRAVDLICAPDAPDAGVRSLQSALAMSGVVGTHFAPLSREGVRNGVHKALLSGRLVGAALPSVMGTVGDLAPAIGGGRADTARLQADVAKLEAELRTLPGRAGRQAEADRLERELSFWQKTVIASNPVLNATASAMALWAKLFPPEQAGEGEMSDKIAKVLARVPAHIDGEEAKKALAELFTPAALAAAAVVLGVWAASHFFGAGFAVDAVILAIGLILVGWEIFRAMGLMLDALKLVYESDITDTDALDRAASLLADAIERLGVGAFLALVTRGAGRLAKAGGGARKARAAKPEVEGPRRRSQRKRRQSSIVREKGTRQDLEDMYRSYPWIDSDAKLQSHIDGTDFSKPIYKTTLPPNSIVVQFVRADNGRVGTHFAPPGTSMDELGINGDRVLRTFVTNDEIQVIESTAASFPIGKIPGVGGTGGGQQYIFGPDFADKLTPGG